MSLYHGISPDGETVFLENGSVNLRLRCEFKTSEGSKQYRVLRLEKDFGEAKKGQVVAYSFTGEPDSLNGDYELLMAGPEMELVCQRWRDACAESGETPDVGPAGEEAPKPQPKPAAPKPQPKPAAPKPEAGKGAYSGISPDGETVFLERGSEMVRATCVKKGVFGGVPCRLLKCEGAVGGNPKGASVPFRFVGDGDSLNGEYHLLNSGDKGYAELMGGSAPKPASPKPQPKPAAPKPQPASTATSSGCYPVYFGKGWAKASFVMYIFAIICSVTVVPFFGLLVFYALKSGEIPLDKIPTQFLQIVVALLIVLVLLTFPIISLSASIRGIKERNDPTDVIHQTTIVIGFLTLNFFLILAGYFNFKQLLLTRKVVAVKKGRK